MTTTDKLIDSRACAKLLGFNTFSSFRSMLKRSSDFPQPVVERTARRPALFREADVLRWHENDQKRARNKAGRKIKAKPTCADLDMAAQFFWRSR